MSLRRTYRRRNEWRGAVLVTAFFLGTFTSPVAGAEGDPAKEIDTEKTGDQERMKAMEAALMLQAGETKETGTEAGSSQVQQEVPVEDLKRYQKELLHRPKKRRIHVGYDTDMTYINNRSGAPIHYEKGNTAFRINPSISLDLGKKKTDMKLEYRWNRLYNDKTPESDNFSQELSFRAGRKIFRKITLSLNDRLSRSSVRVAGFDDKKINFDNSHRQALSYDFNSKLTLNFETNYTSTVFPNENWDDQGTFDFQMSPNLAFQLTRKTRLTAGYQNSRPQSHPKTSDVTNHVFRMGYSGKITPKSSLSADFSWTIQDPTSATASNAKKYSTSASYLWQMTSKTSLRFSYSNSYSHSISDSVSGSALFKTVSYSNSDSWGSNVRFRLHRKINAELSFNPSHSHSTTKKTGNANTHSRSFTFPFQVGLDLDLRKGFRVRLTYTYQHKIGDEMKTDENRTHTWFVGTNLLF